MAIKCRHCGGNHFSVKCKERPEEQRASSWEEMVEKYLEEQKNMPFKCTIYLHQGKESKFCADNVSDFWNGIKDNYDHSIYQDFAGIRKLGDSNDSKLYSIGYSYLEPGEYILVSRTHCFDDTRLSTVLAQAVEILRTNRPHSSHDVKQLQELLLLKYNHFSLKHEGSSLELGETRLISKLLAGKDPKRALEDKEGLDEALRSAASNQHDVQEARNHILVSQLLEDIAKQDTPIDETRGGEKKHHAE